MSLFKLAFSNFKRSVREFGVLILSLSFSIFIFFNFQNVIYAKSMEVLLDFNKEYINVVIQAASLVFLTFLFFFIWYASNVFLNQRKKEIGIYIFMGLDNGKIGKMYALEAGFVGLLSLVCGLLSGIFFSKLFQMLLLKLSEISVDIQFSIALEPVLITAGMFLVIYGLMILKGYSSLKRSSVLNLLSGAKQKEMRQEKQALTMVKVAAGTGLLLTGYWEAWTTGDAASLKKALLAVVLVIVGVYLLFSGLIPAILRSFTRNKLFLYRRERNLWLNNLAFRMKRNYRTYAMVTVLMICSVTVMAFSISMKQRYEKIVHFDQTYTYQVISGSKMKGEDIEKGIQQENSVEYWNQYAVLLFPAEFFHSPYADYAYGVASYSQLEQAAKKAELPFAYKPLAEDEVIRLEHEILMSLAAENAHETVEMGEKTYQVISREKTPYLGNFQTFSDIYIVADSVYEVLKQAEGGQEVYFYNYKIENPENMEASRAYLQSLSEANSQGQRMVGVNFTQNQVGEDSWIRVMYSLCLFMFATLILAAGSIIFLKVGNEAYEDQERYQVLKKLGVCQEVLNRSIRNEICFAYYCPFVLMGITSYFSVKALGNVMREDLLRVNLWSAGMIFLLFAVICWMSVKRVQGKVKNPEAS